MRFIDKEFQAALEGDDQLGMVIRAHIHIEAGLNDVLDVLLVSPKHVEKMNLDFSQKVMLATALGLRPRYQSPLLALGTLRNAFAHQLGTTLTKSRVDALYKSFASEDKEIIQISHRKTRSQLDDTQVAEWNRLEPKDRFILMAVTLRALLQATYNQASVRGKGL